MTTSSSNNSGASLKSKLVPWITVGIIVIVALVASTVLINSVNAAKTETKQTTSETASTSSDKEEKDTATVDKDKETVAVPDPDTAPSVEVGQTINLNVSQWGLSVDISSKFGASHYQLIDNNNKLQLNSGLINSLPESCSAMRSQFGFIKDESGKLSVMKPEATCQDATQLYNEIWGLLDAATKTVH